MSSKPSRGGLFGWLRGEARPNDPTDVVPISEKARIAPARPESLLQDRLRDRGEIGKGGMSTIRKVFDKNLLRYIAMKVLNLKYAGDSGEVQRFIEEAQITGQLEHPNIPPVHEIGEHEGTHYFTMKLIQGETLDSILRSKTYSPVDSTELYRVLEVFDHVCQAISFAHSRGILHCDLKPANIMVGKYAQVYVMDWGVARLKDEFRPSGADRETLALATVSSRAEDDSGKIVGTLAYMPPELAQGWLEEIDERTDVFSLGAILYRALAGKPPYHDKDFGTNFANALEAKITPPQEVRPGINLPVRLCDIAMKALGRDPADRYQSVDALREDVEIFMRGGPGFPRRTFAAGTLIIKEGEPGSTAYVIERGTCRVFKMIDGQKNVIREMGPGAVFGEAAVLSSQPRTAYVEAVDDVTALEVTREAIEREIGQTQWVGSLVKALAERFHDLDATLARARQRLLAAETVLRYICSTAETGRAGERVARWSELRETLCSRLGEAEDEVIEFVQAIDGITVDPETDSIVVTTHRSSPREGEK
ncbi:MAG: serine/threonine-protein kinase [Acidobacteriota bacterium]